MKTSTAKLKKLNTKTVYGFKRHLAGGNNNFMDPTITNTSATTGATTTTGTMIMI